jgi:hypothetical protein
MIEVIKQLVEALQTYSDKHRKTYLLEGAWDEEITKGDAAIQAGNQAIAELENQEPVATVTSETGADITMSWWHEPALPMGTKLFTHPPQRTWVGLTDADFREIYETYPIVEEDPWDHERAIEAKLKEKNT